MGYRTWKPQRDTLELCAEAGEFLLQAGFVKHIVSRRSPACYYRWPDRPQLIRVADHSAGKGTNGLGKVVSRITFTGTLAHGRMLISDEAVETMVARAIGFYFLRSSARSSADRASGPEPECRRFESCRARQPTAPLTAS